MHWHVHALVLARGRPWLPRLPPVAHLAEVRAQARDGRLLERAREQSKRRGTPVSATSLLLAARRAVEQYRAGRLVLCGARTLRAVADRYGYGVVDWSGGGASLDGAAARYLAKVASVAYAGKVGGAAGALDPAGALAAVMERRRGVWAWGALGGVGRTSDDVDPALVRIAEEPRDRAPLPPDFSVGDLAALADVPRLRRVGVPSSGDGLAVGGAPYALGFSGRTNPRPVGRGAGDPWGVAVGWAGGGAAPPAIWRPRAWWTPAVLDVSAARDGSQLVAVSGGWASPMAAPGAGWRGLWRWLLAAGWRRARHAGIVAGRAAGREWDRAAAADLERAYVASLRAMGADVVGLTGEGWPARRPRAAASDADRARWEDEAGTSGPPWLHTGCAGCAWCPPLDAVGWRE